jgi:FlaA1/EpsC-like NDP-sugar epimerase
MLGRTRPVFEHDLSVSEDELVDRIRASSFLVLGGAGSIGQAVVLELFRRRPQRLHIVDLSENNLVELVRSIRSSIGYIDGDFRTLALDAQSTEFRAFVGTSAPYDYVLNLAALKHVRSERDPFTLMRLVQTNVLMTVSTLQLAIDRGSCGYFSVSTDKAVNPANAMGASKRVMELCLAARGNEIRATSARFANVAFSDGSLLHGFGLRLAKRQPLSAPQDVRRYFITSREGALLCLLSCLLGRSLDCFFPAPDQGFQPTSFRHVAESYLREQGLEPYPCASEEEARRRVEELSAKGCWPCYFFDSDTTGEKTIEEFFSLNEDVELGRFREIGVARLSPPDDPAALGRFFEAVSHLYHADAWSRNDILTPLQALVPEFRHHETGKFLDQRM